RFHGVSESVELFSPHLCLSDVKTVGQLTVTDGTKLSEYIELVDGIYLNEIMLEINPKATVQRTNKKVNNDSTLRIQNLSILIRQIKAFYQVRAVWTGITAARD
uniref:HOOK N-terminal domain-containing protein n=1 Tax=Periophthalmus magnuspinnatus TaxID=409849 RepID=A0A3B3ZIG9_9GOBI